MRTKIFNKYFQIGWTQWHYLFQHEGNLVNEPQFKFLEKGKHTHCWDVGCSFGLWTYYAASYPFCAKVVAFDLSPAAAKNCKTNAGDFSHNVTVVPKPLTLAQTFYSVPFTSHQANTLKPGSEISMDWRQAISLYGTPNCIKMDIEGGELDFLSSPDFVNWIHANEIQFFVECHSPLAERLARRAGLKQHETTNHFYS